jgi:hypothetical protein
VDSVNRRLRSVGFVLGQGQEADADLWRIWTANDMHHDAPLGQVDALVHGLAFLSVWGNDEDPGTPVMAFESSHQVQVKYAPGSGDRRVAAALKRWHDVDAGEVRATLYLPDQVRRYRVASVTDTGAPLGGWSLEDVLPNPLGAVPVVPMVNRGRLLNRDGRSELASVAPVADAINKLATDMMVTSEFFQSPRRWATGLQMSANPTEREKLQAEAAAFWDHAAKQKTLLGGVGVQFGQFPEADMGGFVAAINMLTSALAAIGGLPPDDLGLNQVNPASAEARRAAETVLTLRAEEKQSAFGRAYVRAMRLAVAAREGLPVASLPAEFSSMAVDWRDPATQAIAQEMDAAVKGHQAGIYDTDAAQQRVGMGPVERAAMRARQAEAAAEAATADTRRRMEFARELVRTDGLTLNAAMAAVGLLQAAAVNSAEAGSSAGTGATTPAAPTGA